MLKWEMSQKVESRQFLADLTDAKDTLVDSTLIAIMMHPEAKKRLTAFVAAVKKAAGALEKASAKGSANKTHVVAYLSVIASLVEAIRGCFDFTVCKPQPTCGPGEYISADSSFSARSCDYCPDGTYRKDSAHREEACIEGLEDMADTIAIAVDGVGRGDDTRPWTS